MRELNDKELNKVSGGIAEGYASKYTHQVYKEYLANYVNQRVYAKKNNKKWAFGILQGCDPVRQGSIHCTILVEDCADSDKGSWLNKVIQFPTGTRTTYSVFADN